MRTPGLLSLCLEKLGRHGRLGQDAREVPKRTDFVRTFFGDRA